MESSPPEILSYSSRKNDAAITFINSTAMNGVLLQREWAFDFVVSADLLLVRINNVGSTHARFCWHMHLCVFYNIMHYSICQLRPLRHATHGRFLSIRNIKRCAYTP